MEVVLQSYLAYINKPHLAYGSKKSEEDCIMDDIKKVSGYTVKNLWPVYSSEKEKEKAEQALIKHILQDYNKLNMARKIIK